MSQRKPIRFQTYPINNTVVIIKGHRMFLYLSTLYPVLPYNRLLFKQFLLYQMYLVNFSFTFYKYRTPRHRSVHLMATVKVPSSCGGCPTGNGEKQGSSQAESSCSLLFLHFLCRTSCARAWYMWQLRNYGFQIHNTEISKLAITLFSI